MICARCDKTIRPGQAYDAEPIHAGSGPGETTYLHGGPCVRVPMQVAPERGTSAYWWSPHSQPRRG